MNNPILVENHINMIIAGQSNAVARNDENAGQPSDLPIDGVIPKAYYYDNTGFVPYALNMNVQGDNTGGYGVEYRLAKTILDNNLGFEKFNLLKYAYGGSRIGTGGKWNVPENGSLITGLINKTNTIKKPFDYFIWVQGENDASTPELANAYEDNLRTFVNYIFEKIKPRYFIIAELIFSPKPNQVANGDTIRLAQQKIAGENPRVILVNSNTNPSLKGDHIHYTPTGIDDLANRIYNKLGDNLTS